MGVSGFTMNGKRFVILPEVEYHRLREPRRGTAADDEWGLPPLPAKSPDGNLPAIEYARAVIARDVIRSRRRLGLSQAELARRADVRVETLNRVERAKMTASEAVMERIDAVLNDPKSSARASK